MESCGIALAPGHGQKPEGSCPCLFLGSCVLMALSGSFLCQEFEQKWWSYLWALLGDQLFLSGIGLSAGSPMEELEKGLKELRGFAAPWREQQCQQARPPRAPGDWTTYQRIYMEGPMALGTYVAEDGLVWSSVRGAALEPEGV